MLSLFRFAAYASKGKIPLSLSNAVICFNIHDGHALGFSTNGPSYKSFNRGSNGDQIWRLPSLDTVKYRQIKLHTRTCDTHALEMIG